MTMYLRRRAQFSAGYAYAASDSPSQRNHGGHTYVCELTVGGTIDPQTGMVVNIRDVDAVLKKRIISVLDGVLLNEVGAFRDLPPTPENIARFIWDECAPALPIHSPLVRVTLWPYPAAWVTLSTLESGSPMLMLTRTYDFSASHRLHSLSLSDTENAEIFGKCNWTHGHGHNYEIEVTVAGNPDARSGELVPYALLDRLVEEEVLIPYDHKHLNYDVPEFRALNPTSENLTQVIWEKLARRFSEMSLPAARLYKVAVRETARNYFEYYGENS